MTIFLLLLDLVLFVNLFEETSIEEQLIAAGDFEMLWAMWGVEASK